MFSRRLQIVCIGFLLLAVAGARAQELVSARVLSSEGPIKIRRQPDGQPQIQKIAFKVNEELRAGDCVITGRGARDDRGVGRPDARPESGRGDAQPGGARPDQSPRGGGRRP